MRAQEDLLGHFLRVPVREGTEQPGHQPEDPGLVPLHERAKQLRVAGLEVFRDEGLILHKVVSAAAVGRVSA